VATRTSSTSGLWSADATWGGNTPPGDGDIAVIATGHTVTVAANVTVGGNGSGIGDAITINATDATTFGKLIVNDGVTLTLKGFGTASNRAMLINRYAQFEPAPGAIIHVDCASDYQTFIDNRGIINAIGTAPKPITFSVPAANYSWNNASGTETKSGASWTYDGEANIAVRNTTNAWIGNSAGTGIGSFGDSSVSFSSQSPGTICQTEVATLAEVTSAGKYYVDYHTGVIYFYHLTAGGNPSFGVDYKYLTFTKGWAVKSIQDTTYNEAKFEYCNFSYMGATGARQYANEVRYKKSATEAANRLFRLNHCTVSFCKGFLGMKDMVGTLADPINITENNFNHCTSISFAACVGLTESAASSYINISSNVLDCQEFVQVRHGNLLITTHVGLTINNNTGTCSNFLVGGTGSKLSASTVSGNVIDGTGAVLDARMFFEPQGASGSHLVIEDNNFRRGNRLASGVMGYVTMRRNIFDTFPHHWITAPTANDVYCPDLLVENNLFFSRNTAAGGVLETGYNHRAHLHNWQLVNNTLGRGHNSLVSLGDTQDTLTQSLVTGLVVANNLVYQPVYGINRNAHDADEYNPHHIIALDHNLVYNPSTGQVTNYNKQATFEKGGLAYNSDATRNIDGVALFDPLYTLPEATERSLVFTYTSATNQTLTWGGGAAVQLVVDDGTATAGANDSAGLFGTLTDSGASWSTTLNSGTVVRCKWVKITGGTGSGQMRAITNNTATVLTTVPAWTTPPDATSTYTIIESEVQLFDSGATNYVRAGIYLPELPTSTQTDAGITIASYAITTDPLLVDAAGNDPADYEIETGSPAIDEANAAYAPDEDYFETERTTADIGFFEFEAEDSGGLYRGPNYSAGMSPAFSPTNIPAFLLGRP
jgi:hypothetical protein